MRKSLSRMLSAGRNGSRRRPLFFEPLENRLLLDVGVAALADDFFYVPQNSGADFLDVLGNDAFADDYSGEREITSVSYGSEGGWIEIGEDSARISYTPPADFAGTETFVYYVDGQFSATATVTVFSPVHNDVYQFPPDGEAKTLEVLANDPFWADYDGPREITAISETLLWGDLEIGPDGKSLIYTPPTDVRGKDAFLYIVDEIYPAEVTIDILNPLKSDHFPDIVQRSEGNVLNVLSNDAFWPGYGGERAITHLIEPASGGTVTIADGGKSVLYTPSPEFSGWDSFRYVVDGVYETSVSLQVHRPVQNDSFEIDTNTAGYTWMVTENDVYSYYEGSQRITRDVIDRVTSVGETEHGGTVTITSNGQGIVYSAAAGFEGTDTFEYVADQKHPATVTVRVTRPVRDDYFGKGVYEDTVANRLDVLDNDFMGNGYEGPGTITSVSEPAEGGVVEMVDGGKSLLYTPPGDFRGQDTFHYTVDGELVAEVTVNVGSIIVGDSYRFEPNPWRTAYSLPVLENDHFGWNYPGSGLITAVSETENGGSVSIADSGRSLQFLPPEGGSDRFTYTVDGKYEATVSVRFSNYLSGDSFVVDQNNPASELDPLANDFRYGDGRYYNGPRQITSVGPTEQGGTVTIGADRKTVSYEPAADFLGTDRFTYTVDGVMQRTITVQVIRRVRDDVFRVEPDSLENALSVLVNDLFGADYSGAGRVTAVSEADAGATAAVSEDGRSIIYTPAAGFSGEDELTYTVDGHLKAQVTIWVAESVEEILPRFESDQEFRQWVLDDAVQRYEYLFGTPGSPSVPIYRGDDWMTLDAGASPNAESGGSSRMHSETNVQVAGVDEADIIETDGSSLFILSGDELIIAKAWPAHSMKITSRVTIEGEPVGEYLQGDRLTVVSKSQSDPWLRPWEPLDLGFAGGLVRDMWWPIPQSSDTWVTVFDVSNREAPKVIEKTKLDGTYVESRRIDDTVFLVLRDEGIYDWLPRPELIEVDESSYVYETREQYSERMMAEMDDFLPQYTSYGAGGEVLEAGTLHAGENVSRPLGEDIGRLVSVVSMDISDNELGIVASTGIFTTGASEIYGSLDNLYIFDQQYTWEDGTVTDVLKFDWDAETANVEFAAKGRVPGRMLNQFSADEYDGHLRIATTISNSYSGNWTGRDENVLFVLRDDGGVLEFVGSMQNLALEETIRSVRFMGDRAFVTTFRDIDPLFALDLSDPTNPRGRGHVILPGFNSYMQLIDEDHLLTVGRNTPAGFAGPTQVSLFDIADLTRPRLIDQYTFERFSTSEAETEHHAFGWFVEHGVLAMPSARVYSQRVDLDGDGYHETQQTVREDQLVLFDIDVTATRQSGDGITLRGEVEHDSPVRRSAFIEQVLYSVAETSVWAVSIEDPSIQYAEIRWESEPEPGPGPIILWGGGEVGPHIQTIDDYGAGFRTDGQWGSRSDQGFGGGVHYRQAGSGQDVATWTFAVEPGRYQVAVTWPDYDNRATNAPFTVRDGSTSLGTVRVDQELAPDDFIEDRIGWETLGTFAILGDRLVVTLSDDADEYVIADAVRIERLADQPGDANFDGLVDISDFNIWNQHKFSTGTDFSHGDFNGDGVTDLSDFNIWNAHKFTAAPSPAPVDVVLAEVEQQGSDAPLQFFGGLAWLQEVEQGGDAEQSSEHGRPSETQIDKLLSTYWR